jgi:DNA-binding transcriptional MerR regulator
MASKVNIKELSKLYYSISEVAEMFDVNMSLIRFWEKEFPVLQPKKNMKGNRSYSPKEIEKLARIYELVKVQGYTLDGAKKALRTRISEKNPVVEMPTKVNSESELIEKLEQIKMKLISIRSKI